jgi:pilus assembly protein CpaC
MPSRYSYLRTLLIAPLLTSLFTPAARGAETAPDERLSVTVGKSIMVDSPLSIQRVAVASGVMAEVMAVNSKEILVNGLAPGETTLVLWQQGGARTVYALNVEPAAPPVDKVREELARALPDQDVSLDLQGGTVFLRGKVRDLITSQRAAAIAGSLGKVINLLYVDVPPAEAQILLKVRFANIDRSASRQLGANIFSTGAGNTIGAVSTGLFPSPTVTPQTGQPTQLTLSDALNLFLFRPDMNLGATISALESKSLLEILAEPNVMATDGKAASFVAGGEFPFPTVQGGAVSGAVTISFREFGIKINFLPTVTPRGTIQLHVTPEVSSLDFANGLTFQGYTIPALDTRRVDTNVELESGQSFAIAGLLDNQITKTLSKIPGIGDIPVLGKLFQSVNTSKSNTELLIIVTPELVRPLAAGQTIRDIPMPEKFLKDASPTAPRTPGSDVTGPAPALPQKETLPVERLEQIKALEAARTAQASAPAGSSSGGQGGTR